ncbi:hypothetical protein ACFS5J_04200 [Flavobacterium chuncheonense]|uniref:DUF2490 domain-containing protein n=1 Tax=Flavobacterium chuncheonense TaxID=2026653 RepID=A0ABW5YJZ4_9FLAO
MNFLRRNIIIVIFCFAFYGVQVWGQKDFFHDISFQTNLLHNEKITVLSESNWMHNYSESRWHRLGFNVEVLRKLENWTFLGGLVNNYTFDEQIDNFYELRPWLGIALQTPITDKLFLKQRLRIENRNIFYGDKIKYQSILRTRFDVALEYNFPKSKVRTDIEWFIRKDPALSDRYNSRRSYRLQYSYFGFKKMIFSIGYKYQRFNRKYNPEANDGHTIEIIAKI